MNIEDGFTAFSINPEVKGSKKSKEIIKFKAKITGRPGSRSKSNNFTPANFSRFSPKNDLNIDI